ncbi:spore germination protein GerW family protein [Methanofollis sp. W23]|uniref:GerW family sporulation protein n=1 Tax=Methanofollis sp. W23 TaxID=2817849 RepID=UPI001AE291BB|nr:spore germination protein GerW family protein [Methanofollis sp. W23]
MPGEQMVKVTAEELRNFITAKAIIGEPLDLGDKVVFSIARFGFAFGAGVGKGSGEEGEGGGAGGGVDPIALLVVYKEIKGPGGVQIFSVSKKGAVAEVIETIGETIPPVIEKVASVVGERKQETEKPEEK